MHTRFIVIRHCEAEGNIKRIFQGHYDGCVTENGKIQLSLLAERMKAYPFDVIYSSPLKRAYETAKAANRHYGLPIEIEQDLIEMNGGDWEGELFSDFAEKFPEENEAWKHRPWEFAARNGERMTEVYERIRNLVLRLAKEQKGKTVCLASHGCTIRNLLCWVKGYPLERILEVGWSDNTGICIFDVDEAGIPSLVAENDSSHLPFENTTLGKQTWWKDNVPEDRFEAN